MNPQTQGGFYYLHENGSVIYKKFKPEMEPGGFVKRVWKIDTTSRFDAWIICIEALAMGADKKRIEELATLWQLTDDDAEVFAGLSDSQLVLSKDGDSWCATFGDFVDLQESQAGFGDTALEALAALARPGLIDDQERSC